LVKDGRKAWIESCAVRYVSIWIPHYSRIQKIWRAYRVRSVYAEYLDSAPPPSNPLLEPSYHLRKLRAATRDLAESTTRNTQDIDEFLKENDSQLLASREIFESCVTGIQDNHLFNNGEVLDWEVVWENAVDRDFIQKSGEKETVGGSCCSICLGTMHVSGPVVVNTETYHKNVGFEAGAGTFIPEPKTRVRVATKTLTIKRTTIPIRKPARFIAPAAERNKRITKNPVPKKSILKEPNPPPAKQTRQALSLLSCSHVYHSTCISSFERMNFEKYSHSCPVCRAVDYAKHSVDEILMGLAEGSFEVERAFERLVLENGEKSFETLRGFINI
jgi:hypothetical protein